MWVIRSLCAELRLAGLLLQVERGRFHCFFGGSACDELAQRQSRLHLLLHDQLLEVGLDVSQS